MLKGALALATVLTALSVGGAANAAAGSDGTHGKAHDDATLAHRRTTEMERERRAAHDSSVGPTLAAVAGQDTTGDPDPINDCHGDITSYAGSYSPDAVGVSFSTVCGSNPKSDANWTVGISHIIWAIDVNNDGVEDYDIFYDNFSGVEARIIRASDSAVVCDATPNWDGNATFGASFSPNCIGNPDSYRLQTYMVWDEAPFADTCECPFDVAPNSFGFSAPITRETPPPPAAPVGDGPSAASAQPGQLDVFVRGLDDAVWTRHFNGSAWSGWTSLGGTVTTKPTAVSSAPGHLYLFARGADNALWYKTFDGSTWSGWTTLGGILSTGVAAESRASGTVDVFVGGADKAAWFKSLGANGWGGWASLGGVITATPAAASAGPGTIGLFVRGGDNALWFQTLNGSAWSGWSTLGGVLTTAPGAASRSAGNYEVYVRGGDNALWTRTLASGWSTLGGLITSPAAPVSAGPGTMDVFVRGADNALWTNHDGGGGFAGWNSLGGGMR